MKQHPKYSILIILFLSYSLLAGISLTQGSIEAPLTFNEITIYDVFQSGPYISIILDYNFSTTTLLSDSGTLAIVIAYVNHSSSNIEAIELFFHTPSNDFHLFWMIGDPLQEVQQWYLGNIFEHYQVQENQLDLSFIEFLNINDPTIEILVKARILEDVTISSQSDDFSIILEYFFDVLPLPAWSYSYPTTTSTFTTSWTTSTHSDTSTTKPSITTGFSFLIILGIIFYQVTHRKKL